MLPVLEGILNRPERTTEKAPANVAEALEPRVS
jgi:hypothetical protein